MRDSEWTQSTISGCLDAEFSGEWGTEPRGAPNTCVLRATDIDDDGHVIGVGVARRVSQRKVDAKQLREGDILLEASGGGPDKPVGRVAHFGGREGAHLVSNFFRTLRPGPQVDSRFLSWRLQKLWRSPAIWAFQQQTTGIINLKLADYLDADLELPPLREQKSIAGVLDSIDDAIRKTEQIIAKLQQVKQGLLHDLLTRGIDDNGELRDPERHPEQFQDSPLGRIPKGWAVSLVDDVGVRGSGHTPSKSVGAYWNGGIKWVSLADSNKLDQLYIFQTDKEISELGIANSSAVKHPPGTVIVSRDAGVGKSAILGAEMAVSQHFIAWRCTPRLNEVFFYYWLQHKKSLFESIAFGSTIKTIGLPFFKRLSMAVPTRHEQDASSLRLLEVERAFLASAAEAEKLRLLKQGLAEDLLTGRVRTTSLAEFFP